MCSTPGKLDQITLFKKRFHPLFRDGTLEFRVGFLIIQECLIPHNLRPIGIHDLKRPFRATLKLHNDNLYTHTILGEVTTKLRIDDVGHPGCQRWLR